MLKKLLTQNTCAKCRQCCIFSNYDVWDLPVLSGEIREQCRTVLPELEFISKGTESYLFRIKKTDPDGLFACPVLDLENGCLLGDQKPFDCQIFPFQIVRIQNRNAIVLSRLCDSMMNTPVRKLTDFLEQELAQKIFSYAQEHPDVIRYYDGHSPVLFWEQDKF
ncbi:MAG: hypothetical protein K2G25_06445 [Oscillospiraceae bacterium]|nr:hypothetical protein [Oscillospiraceae bacterium]